MSSDVVLQDINKLLVTLEWVHITHHGFCPYKELCCSDPTVNGRGVRVYCISSNRFISAVDITCWKWDLYLFFR